MPKVTVDGKTMIEPDITINGTALNFAQAMTVRVAIETFAMSAADPEMGEIGQAYRARIEEIRQMMYKAR